MQGVIRVENRVLLFLLAAACVAILVCSGCGAPPEELTIVPSTAVAVAGHSVQMTVPHWKGSIVWQVNGTSGGNSKLGTIDSSGLYSAPLVLPFQSVTIAAYLQGRSIPVSLLLPLSNPQPSVASGQTSILASDSSVQLSISGSGFTPASKIIVGDTPLTTEYETTSELQASVPLTVVQGAADLEISVQNPSPGGGTAQSIRVPVLSAAIGTVFSSEARQFLVPSLPGGTVWTVDGIVGGNASTGTISQNGQFIAPDAPPAADITVTASSGASAKISGSATIHIENAVPVLTSVPSFLTASGTSVTVAVHGSGFSRQSTVLINGAVVPTRFINTAELDCDVLISTGAEGSLLTAAVQTPSPGGGITPEKSISVIAPGVLTGTTHPLVANYEITVPADGSVSVEFVGSDGITRRTWSRPLPSGGGTASILVAGMKADSVYSIRGHVQLADGSDFYDGNQSFTTGDLPAIAFPQISISEDHSLPLGGGVDLTNALGRLGNNLIAALDSDGSVVWYYYNPALASASIFPVRALSNGDFVVNQNALTEVDLTGTIIRSIDVPTLNQAISDAGYSLTVNQIHHEIIETPNGHWVFLVDEFKDFTDLPGYPGVTHVRADAIVELDPQTWKVGWVWRALDHLDVNRHPYLFPDWTHGNALVYTSDGNLLVSFRHQSWIVKVKYDDGNGDGSVIWRLGDGGDFSLDGGDRSRWFYAQHFPSLLSSDGSKFKLAIFDNGNVRPDADGTSCDVSNTCYTRAVIMEVDESSRTASIKWQYTPGWFAAWGGSIVQLANGDVEFDSSVVDGGPSRIVEVTGTDHPQVVWTLYSNQNFYRAYRIPSLYPGVAW